MTLHPVSAPLSGGRLTIDRRALLANWEACAALAGPAETAAVVKADAYGCGLAGAAALFAANGCRTFFVALPSEGAALRAVVPDAAIYVLGGFPDGAARIYRTHRLRPVLGSAEDVAAWLAEAGSDAEPPALHVDTGMNRLGLRPEEAVALAASADVMARLRPALIMSHLAAADDPHHPLTSLQIDRFRTVLAHFPGVPGSLANSAALLSRPDATFDMVRPGIAVYGGRSVRGRAPLATVATAEARIVQVRTVPAGETVGYGGAYAVTRPSRIAIAAVGYADGYPRRAFEAGVEVALEGRRAPLAGRISMDLIAIDVTDLPDRAARRGAWAELFGPTIPVDDVAERCNTIGYELLAQTGQRLERCFI